MRESSSCGHATCLTSREIRLPSSHRSQRDPDRRSRGQHLRLWAGESSHCVCDRHRTYLIRGTNIDHRTAVAHVYARVTETRVRRSVDSSVCLVWPLALRLLVLATAARVSFGSRSVISCGISRTIGIRIAATGQSHGSAGCAARRRRHIPLPLRPLFPLSRCSRCSRCSAVCARGCDAPRTAAAR